MFSVRLYCFHLPFSFLSLLYLVPMWGVGAIVVVVLALVACLCFCIYKKCFNKGKKPKKVRERKGGRGRRKKDKEGEDGDDKKVRRMKPEDNHVAYTDFYFNRSTACTLLSGSAPNF